MSIFIENKYTRWYYNIISNAQSQLRKKKTGIYYESHHIVPRSLSGSNEKSNLVLLTAKEHFLCHLLLTKMTLGYAYHKMVYAYNCFINHDMTLNIHSKLYDRLRSEYYILISNQTSGIRNPFYGKKHTAETLRVIKEKRVQQKIFGMVGKKHSEESKKRMSESAMGRQPHNKGKTGFLKGFKWYNNGIDQTKCLPENMPIGWISGRLSDFKLKISAKNQGYKHTDDARKKISESSSRRWRLFRDMKNGA